jgi:NADPH-dependent 2,4-dienoyl-CoA reductase/sulfur reductase-like enzyme
VRRLDAARLELVLEDGQTLTPDAVLIASGGVPRRLDVPGAALPGVLTLRSRDDAERLIDLAAKASRVVIVGASFIGMEAAASLRTRGLEVTVTAPDDVPLAGALGAVVGALVRDVHEQHGVRFALGRHIATISGDGSVSAVQLDDGTTLDCDLVLAGIGVTPATGFVEGVSLDPDGGIPVDERLRAAPGVWAAGDVARYREPHTGRDVRIEHWRLAEQHGRAAARAIMGGAEPFTGVPFFWTQHFDLRIGYAGAGRGWDRQIILGDVTGRDFLVFYAAGDQLLAACGTRDRELGAFMELMRLGRLPPADELEAGGDVQLMGRLDQG